MRGEELERGLWVLGEIGDEGGKEEILKERGRRWKLEEQIILGSFYRALLLLRTLGSRARKLQGFL
jgi:hypothetical protein